MTLDIHEISFNTVARSTSNGEDSHWSEHTVTVPDTEVWYLDEFVFSYQNFTQSYSSDSGSIQVQFGVFRQLPGTDELVGTWHGNSAQGTDGTLVTLDERVSGCDLVVRQRLTAYSSHSSSHDGAAFHMVARQVI